MKNICTLLTILLITLHANAQSLTLDFANSFGSSNDDVGRSIAVDASGNVYTTGEFSGTADFDPGSGVSNLTSMGNEDIFISKLDASGNFQWAKQIGGTNTDVAYAIALDASGNIYLTGIFKATADFDPGSGVFNLTSSVNSFDAFIVKLSNAGNLIWAKKIGGGGIDFGSSIDVDGLGNVYTTGHFNSSVDFDPGVGTFSIFSNGFDDIYVLKLNAAGNFVAVLRMGGPLVESSRAIKVNAAGEIHLAGFFSGIVDFDPGAGIMNLTSIGNRDAFVCKLNPAGNLLWVKQFGGSEDDEVYGLALDALNNVYTIGNYKNTVDFDPGAGTSINTSNGFNDVFISKLNASGNFLWAKTVGSVSFEEGNAIVVDAWGDVYATGYFRDTVDFDPGAATQNLIAIGNHDMYTLKLDASGNFVWVSQLGGTMNSWGRALAIDATGRIHSTGEFDGSMDIDPGTGIQNITAMGGTDIFVHKMHQTGVGISNNGTKEQFAIFPNPGDGNLTIDLGTTESMITVNVKNMLEQIILTKNFSFTDKINLKLDLPPSLYVIEILSKENLWSSQKYIKY